MGQCTKFIINDSSSSEEQTLPRAFGSVETWNRSREAEHHHFVRQSVDLQVTPMATTHRPASTIFFRSTREELPGSITLKKPENRSEPKYSHKAKPHTRARMGHFSYVSNQRRLLPACRETPLEHVSTKTCCHRQQGPASTVITRRAFLCS